MTALRSAEAICARRWAGLGEGQGEGEGAAAAAAAAAALRRLRQAGWFGGSSGTKEASPRPGDDVLEGLLIGVSMLSPLEQLRRESTALEASLGEAVAAEDMGRAAALQARLSSTRHRQARWQRHEGRGRAGRTSGGVPVLLDVDAMLAALVGCGFPSLIPGAMVPTAVTAAGALVAQAKSSRERRERMLAMTRVQVANAQAQKLKSMATALVAAQKQRRERMAADAEREPAAMGLLALWQHIAATYGAACRAGAAADKGFGATTGRRAAGSLAAWTGADSFHRRGGALTTGHRSGSKQHTAFAASVAHWRRLDRRTHVFALLLGAGDDHASAGAMITPAAPPREVELQRGWATELVLLALEEIQRIVPRHHRPVSSAPGRRGHHSVNGFRLPWTVPFGSACRACLHAAAVLLPGLQAAAGQAAGAAAAAEEQLCGACSDSELGFARQVLRRARGGLAEAVTEMQQRREVEEEDMAMATGPGDDNQQTAAAAAAAAAAATAATTPSKLSRLARQQSARAEKRLQQLEASRAAALAALAEAVAQRRLCCQAAARLDLRPEPEPERGPAATGLAESTDGNETEPAELRQPGVTAADDVPETPVSGRRTLRALLGGLNHVATKSSGAAAAAAVATTTPHTRRTYSLDECIDPRSRQSWCRLSAPLQAEVQLDLVLELLILAVFPAVHKPFVGSTQLPPGAHAGTPSPELYESVLSQVRLMM
eukprot:COSAG01_NODE_172_length_23108_cov_26.690496_23_plen_718_part_00